jgi:hypothetical protein
MSRYITSYGQCVAKTLILRILRVSCATSIAQALDHYETLIEVSGELSVYRRIIHTPELGQTAADFILDACSYRKALATYAATH